MRYGTLSMAEESIDKYKLLPNVDLIPGEDYVSFGLDTLVGTLKNLLEDRVRCDQVRKSGYRKLREGYNLNRAARELNQVLSSL